MRSKGEKIRPILSRKAQAVKGLLLLAILLGCNLLLGIVNVLPGQARRDAERQEGLGDGQTIWQQWEWGMSIDQKQSYLSVNERELMFVNVGIHGWIGDLRGGGWKYSEPLILRQQTGFPAQCGIYELQDSNTHIVYLVGRVADYRIEKVVFALRWGFEVETVELTEKDFIQNEDGVFFVYRVQASDRVGGGIEAQLAGVDVTVLDGDGDPLLWTDQEGYVTDSYYVEDRILADPPYRWSH